MKTVFIFLSFIFLSFPAFSTCKIKHRNKKIFIDECFVKKATLLHYKNLSIKYPVLKRLKTADKETPLMLALKFSKKKDLLNWLAEKDLNLRARNIHKQNALMYLARYVSDRDVVENFLNIGKITEKDLKQKDHYKRTALIFSIYGDQDKSIVELFLKRSNVNLKDSHGRSALIYAIIYSNIDVMELLIENGAKLNTKDKKGKTALMYAAENSEEKYEFLLNQGANPDYKDRRGRKAEHYLKSSFLSLPKNLVLLRSMRKI